MPKNMAKNYGEQAFRILQFAFVIAPFFAGLDKFFNLLTDWPQYLSPLYLRMIPFDHEQIMPIVGIVEMIAGIGVIFKPKVFSCIICIWLALIIINLLATGMYFDIALRDFGLFLGALALNRLSIKYN